MPHSVKEGRRSAPPVKSIHTNQDQTRIRKLKESVCFWIENDLKYKLFVNSEAIPFNKQSIKQHLTISPNSQTLNKQLHLLGVRMGYI